MSSQKLVLLSLVIIFLPLTSCYGGRLMMPKYKHSYGTVNVDDFGAKPFDGNDDTEAFEKAWNEACSKGLTLVVPSNSTYQLKPIKFSGPCQPNTAFKIYGTIEAWPDMSVYEQDRRHWIVFDGIKGLIVDGGGTIDGNGRQWWEKSCKINKNLPCKEGPTAVTFHECKKLRVTDILFTNAQQMHVVFQNCNNVKASFLKVIAPGDSPNTDGIHITDTENIRIFDSVISTGDDCISIVSGSKHVRAINITCGPGHGISVGSLGAHGSEAQVSNVEVNKATLIGTTNGVRIKTWQGGSGYAKDIRFKNIEMQNVDNAIIIDQQYCDQNEPCQEQESAVKLSNVSYKNIRGTSASEVAIKFDCSKTVPCSEISMEDVSLEGNGNVIATCNNVQFAHTAKFSPQCSS